jgi:hypothetical protein
VTKQVYTCKQKKREKWSGERRERRRKREGGTETHSKMLMTRKTKGGGYRYFLKPYNFSVGLKFFKINK